MAQKRVIIDSDPATGVPNRDVDDGLAFLLMLAAPEIRVEGITINFGNVGALTVIRSRRTCSVWWVVMCLCLKEQKTRLIWGY